MGLLTMQYSRGDFPSFARIAAALPTMSNQILGYVGNQGKEIMKDEIVNGQLLQYRQTEYSKDKYHDRRGRKKVAYGIRYARYVTIYSYPANFFTVSNRRQQKRPIWSTMKAKMSSRLDQILKEFDTKYLQKEFEKYVENPLSRQRM
jgi:hypothetical protein